MSTWHVDYTRPGWTRPTSACDCGADREIGIHDADCPQAVDR